MLTGTDLRDEVLVAAEADDKEQRGYQRRVHEREDVDDHLIASQRKHADPERPELFQELHEKRDDRDDQANEERRQQPPAAEYQRFQRCFSPTHLFLLRRVILSPATIAFGRTWPRSV